MNIKNIPIKERPREKALLKGLEFLTDYELLAIIIGSGIKNKNAIELSKELLVKFGNFENLFHQNLNNISRIKGLNKIKSLQLSCIAEIFKRINTFNYFEKVEMKNLDNFINKIQNLIKFENKEILIIFLLNNSNKILNFKKIEGVKSHINMNIYNIVKYVIINNCSKFLILHNHLNNNCEPSINDIEYIKKLKIVSLEFELILLDSIIISNNNFFSFKLNNLI